jgi:DNA-binding transcriptional LysR family regulator
VDLNAILVFARVVDAGSFTGAARALAMPKSTVSRKVSELERRLGARLLQRSTRKLSLTDVGHTFYQHAARMVAEAEEAELAVDRMQEAPRGLLRVTAPLSFAYLARVVSAFLARFPEVQLELVCSDRIVDLVDEGFDLAVRTGRLADSTLIARSLGMLRSYVVASPTFIERNGEPRTPGDLARFDCVVFAGGGERTSWTLQRGGETVTVGVAPRFVVNEFDYLEEAALSGLGIAMLPVLRCDEHIRRKRLSRVLADWCSAEVPLHAVYPSSRHLSPKVKAFLDHLSESNVTAPGGKRSGPRAAG